MFDGFLDFAKQCQSCGESFDIEDAGDGPAIFIIFAAGFTVIPLAFAFLLITNAPPWLVILIWGPVLIGFCLALLRPFRGVMFNLQWRHQAREVVAKDLEG